MKIITCFKLVPEEQDITVTPEHSLNFDRAEAKISSLERAPAIFMPNRWAC